ncbi:hypothetical protein IMY05_C4468000300 [Salix suchowensis]|nr:hypothetical protein IMY05_C4468000300 [Salix suchowensis]
MKRKEKKQLAHSLIEVECATMDHGNAPTKIKHKADKAIIAEFDQGPLHTVSCLHSHRSFAKKAKHSKLPVVCELIGQLARTMYLHNLLPTIMVRTLSEVAVKALDILLRNENMKTIEEKQTMSNGFKARASAILEVPDSFESHSIEQPGALVMAIQAVGSSCLLIYQSALIFHSGIKEEPNPCDTLSHFSHFNWADHEEKTTDEYGNIVTKVIPTTSSITKLVNKLTPRQWEKIIKEAMHHFGSSDNGDYNDGDIEMFDNDWDSDSSTESDSEMPNFMPSQSVIKWVSYDSESD